LQFIQERVAKERSLERIYIAAKERLEKLIYSQKAHMTEKYGVVEQGQLATGRRFLINWDFEPQPIEMRVHLMRAVKNKLPAGNYCFLLTPYERLGGNPIQWSKLGFQGMGHRRPQATRPVKHKGRFFDTTIQVDQSVFCLCPSRKAIRPSNVLVLELFYLAGKDNPKDQIVGWGALPMCNPRFRIVQGRYKIPLLKVEPTPLIDKFQQIEGLYTSELTNWLCNLYVDIRHLSKEHLNKEGKLYREYDLEYDYINKKLCLGPAPLKLKELDEQQAGGKEGQKKEEGKEEPRSSSQAMDNSKVKQGKELASATDPSHPTYQHNGWAPQSNETWYSKREDLFRHPSKEKGKKRRRPSRPTSQAMSELATPKADGGVNKSPSDFRSGIKSLPARGFHREDSSRSSGVTTPKSNRLSIASFMSGGRSSVKKEQEEISSESESSSEEEARSSGDEWVLDGGETRPLLQGKELKVEGQSSALGEGKVRRRRQEGSRWDADALGMESTVKPKPVSRLQVIGR